MNTEKLSEDLTNVITNQFDMLKDKYNLTYEKDFNAFSIGYTMGVFGTIKSVNKNVE